MFFTLIQKDRKSEALKKASNLYQAFYEEFMEREKMKPEAEREYITILSMKIKIKVAMLNADFSEREIEYALGFIFKH